MNTCSEGQPFAANYNPLYSGQGLKGHTGQDWSCGWGSEIKSPVAGLCYKVWTAENTPDPAGYTRVDILVDNGIESYEFELGHLNPTIQPGTQVQVGDVIGIEANHGPVYSGNVPITLAMQKAGDQRGNHRHYQKRPFQKITPTSGMLLTGQDDSTYRDADNLYYQVWNYWNGYDGCIDPTLPVFTRDLWLGSSGYDVYVLQRFLASKGYFTVKPTGYYGTITSASVSAYQKTNGISPILGYFGSKTRGSILPQIPVLNLIQNE